MAYREGRKEYMAKYYNEHKEHLLEYLDKWRKNNKEKINKQRRELITKNRTKYFNNKTCFICKTKENLVLHHVYPETKDSLLKHSAGDIWVWPEERRVMELLFCETLCKSCHSRLHNTKRRIG